MDYPVTGRPAGVMITGWHEWSLGVPIGAVASSAPSSAVWPAANRALYVPFELPGPFSVAKLFLYNGSVVSGNFDIGIYDEQGTRLVSSGSTVQAGTSQIQEVDITDTLLPGPGRFYLAIAVDNITATVFRAGTSVQLVKSFGVAQQESAFPLPAVATFAVVASPYLPYFGLSARTLVA